MAPHGKIINSSRRWYCTVIERNVKKLPNNTNNASGIPAPPDTRLLDTRIRRVVLIPPLHHHPRRCDRSPTRRASSVRHSGGGGSNEHDVYSCPRVWQSDPPLRYPPLSLRKIGNPASVLVFVKCPRGCCRLAGRGDERRQAVFLVSP